MEKTEAQFKNFIKIMIDRNEDGEESDVPHEPNSSQIWREPQPPSPLSPLLFSGHSQQQVTNQEENEDFSEIFAGEKKKSSPPPPRSTLSQKQTNKQRINDKDKVELEKTIENHHHHDHRCLRHCYDQKQSTVDGGWSCSVFGQEKNVSAVVVVVDGNNNNTYHHHSSHQHHHHDDEVSNKRRNFQTQISQNDEERRQNDIDYQLNRHDDHRHRHHHRHHHHHHHHCHNHYDIENIELKSAERFNCLVKTLQNNKNDDDDSFQNTICDKILIDHLCGSCFNNNNNSDLLLTGEKSDYSNSSSNSSSVPVSKAQKFSKKTYCIISQSCDLKLRKTLPKTEPDTARKKVHFVTNAFPIKKPVSQFQCVRCLSRQFQNDSNISFIKFKNLFNVQLVRFECLNFCSDCFIIGSTTTKSSQTKVTVPSQTTTHQTNQSSLNVETTKQTIFFGESSISSKNKDNNINANVHHYLIELNLINLETSALGSINSSSSSSIDHNNSIKFDLYDLLLLVLEKNFDPRLLTCVDCCRCMNGNKPPPQQQLRQHSFRHHLRSINDNQKSLISICRRHSGHSICLVICLCRFSEFSLIDTDKTETVALCDTDSKAKLQSCDTSFPEQLSYCLDLFSEKMVADQEKTNMIHHSHRQLSSYHHRPYTNGGSIQINGVTTPKPFMAANNQNGKSRLFHQNGGANRNIGNNLFKNRFINSISASVLELSSKDSLVPPFHLANGNIINGNNGGGSTDCSLDDDTNSSLESNEDWHYGPGIVDRLRHKFMALSTKQQAKVVFNGGNNHHRLAKRCASLEELTFKSLKNQQQQQLKPSSIVPPQPHTHQMVNGTKKKLMNQQVLNGHGKKLINQINGSNKKEPSSSPPTSISNSNVIEPTPPSVDTNNTKNTSLYPKNIVKQYVKNQNAKFQSSVVVSNGQHVKHVSNGINSNGSPITNGTTNKQQTKNHLTTTSHNALLLSAPQPYIKRKSKSVESLSLQTKLLQFSKKPDLLMTTIDHDNNGGDSSIVLKHPSDNSHQQQTKNEIHSSTTVMNNSKSSLFVDHWEAKNSSSNQLNGQIENNVNEQIDVVAGGLLQPLPTTTTPMDHYCMENDTPNLLKHHMMTTTPKHSPNVVGDGVKRVDNGQQKKLFDNGVTIDNTVQQQPTARLSTSSLIVTQQQLPELQEQKNINKNFNGHDVGVDDVYSQNKFSQQENVLLLNKTSPIELLSSTMTTTAKQMISNNSKTCSDLESKTTMIDDHHSGRLTSGTADKHQTSSSLPSNNNESSLPNHDDQNDDDLATMMMMGVVDSELPKPDTVKTVKLLFEKSSMVSPDPNNNQTIGNSSPVNETTTLQQQQPIVGVVGSSPSLKKTSNILDNNKIKASSPIRKPPIAPKHKIFKDVLLASSSLSAELSCSSPCSSNGNNSTSPSLTPSECFSSSEDCDLAISRNLILARGGGTGGSENSNESPNNSRCSSTLPSSLASLTSEEAATKTDDETIFYDDVDDELDKNHFDDDHRLDDRKTVETSKSSNLVDRDGLKTIVASNNNEQQQVNRSTSIDRLIKNWTTDEDGQCTSVGEKEFPAGVVVVGSENVIVVDSACSPSTQTPQTTTMADSNRQPPPNTMAKKLIANIRPFSTITNNSNVSTISSSSCQANRPNGGNLATARTPPPPPITTNGNNNNSNLTQTTNNNSSELFGDAVLCSSTLSTSKTLPQTTTHQQNNGGGSSSISASMKQSQTSSPNNTNKQTTTTTKTLSPSNSSSTATTTVAVNINRFQSSNNNNIRASVVTPTQASTATSTSSPTILLDVSVVKTAPSTIVNSKNNTMLINGQLSSVTPKNNNANNKQSTTVSKAIENLGKCSKETRTASTIKDLKKCDSMVKNSNDEQSIVVETLKPSLMLHQQQNSSIKEPVNGAISSSSTPTAKSTLWSSQPPMFNKSLPNSGQKRSTNLLKNSSSSPSSSSSIVFDFRDKKNIRPNIAIQPTPFGAKPIPKRIIKEMNANNNRSSSHYNGNAADDDDEDDDEEDVNYGGTTDVPPPSGIRFEGENVIVGSGSLLHKKNKNLSLTFNQSKPSVFEYYRDSESDDDEDDDEDDDDNDYDEGQNDEIEVDSKPNKEEKKNGSLLDITNQQTNIMQKKFPIGNSSLASYKPARTELQSSKFELGITKLANNNDHSNSRSKISQGESRAGNGRETIGKNCDISKNDEITDNDMIKPATLKDTVKFSQSSSASDLLF